MKNLVEVSTENGSWHTESLMQQITKSLNSESLYAMVEMLPSSELHEGDVIIFRVKPRFSQLKSLAFYDEEVKKPYLFVVEYLTISQGKLYYKIDDTIKRIPLDWLNNDGETFAKIKTITL